VDPDRLNASLSPKTRLVASAIAARSPAARHVQRRCRALLALIGAALRRRRCHRRDLPEAA